LLLVLLFESIVLRWPKPGWIATGPKLANPYYVATGAMKNAPGSPRRGLIIAGGVLVWLVA
jgi:hypothetical protein